MAENTSRNFLQQKIDADIAVGKNGGLVHTRFPPEPNGYLHIGHAKAICISFGLAEEFGGKTNLRFDDTNPIKEDVEYVDAIREDIEWLGFKPNGGEYFTSDYFDQLYKYALQLIDDGKAYIDDQSSDDIAKQKGTPT
ncbi:MAG: glutamate--tRNA ligase family protein, partial [Flavobacteriales bacterium]|nr:glutamate--tRNA ligase family protein [Flavobacteriales bacterium]